MVEGINQTLKETLSKWVLDTDCSWVGLFLSLGSTQTQDDPWSHSYSPYIIVSGRPPPIIRQVSTNLPQVRGDEISQLMKQLGNVINQVTKFVQESCHSPLGNRFTNLCAGIRCGQGLDTQLLSPQWKGPYILLF